MKAPGRAQLRSRVQRHSRMRMFRLPSWISESRGCDKVVDGELDIKMANATRPVVEIVPMSLPMPLTKRKRSPSLEVSDEDAGWKQEAKRQKTQFPTVASPEKNVFDGSDKVETLLEPVVDSSRLRDTIETQFSLEILLKHDELRLINQELAKCQVALEQLRRCSLIPYPTAQGTQESRLNITNGTGPALAQRGNVPQWAPAYGVTDGPYSRHYAKWLIPDPSFDGVQVEWNRRSEGSRAGKTVPEGRSTRHSYGESSTPTTKSRNPRSSSGQKLQALSSGYPQTKDKVGPCTLRRADGQMVKLVCKDCNRFDFSSTQGFINHCRIAHKREFKSHEEAAVYSGVAIEMDEAGGIVGEEKSVATPTPATLTPPAAPIGHVHPLILSAPTDQAAYRALLSRIDASLSMFGQGRLPGVTNIPSSAVSSPIKSDSQPKKTLIPSADTPHLSSLMRRKGHGGNLDEFVSEAKKRIDFEDLSSHDDDSEDIERPTPIPQRRLGGLDGADSPPPMRVPVRAAMSPAPFNRPGSSKGPDSRLPALSISPRLSHATPVISTSTPLHHNRPTRVLHDISVSRLDDTTDVDMEMMDGRSVHDLSPHTVASNNAPSLVSDDDDDEYGDDGDAQTASSEAGDDDSVAEIDIEDDGIDKVVPRTVRRNRANSGGDAMRLRKEDKHVTFVSPMKDGSNQRRI